MDRCRKDLHKLIAIKDRGSSFKIQNNNIITLGGFLSEYGNELSTLIVNGQMEI